MRKNREADMKISASAGNGMERACSDACCALPDGEPVTGDRAFWSETAARR